jgi:long-chain acyl-CoA synthetase
MGKDDMINKSYNLREAVTSAKKKAGSRVFIDPLEAEFGSITFNDLDHFVNCYSEFLKSFEVPELERVAVIAGTTTMTALLFVGTLACDRVFVPINPASTETEALAFLDQVTPGLIFCDPQHLRACERWAGKNCAKVIGLTEGSALYKQILSVGVGKPFKSKCCTSDIAEIVFTSGSTGKPKGVVLSHGAVIANAWGLIRRYKLDADDHFLVSVPIFHCGGQIFPILCPLLLGATTTVVEPKVALMKFWDIAAKHDVTWSIVITAFLPVLLQGKPRPTKFKGLLVGGSAVPASIIEQFERKFAIPLSQVYGMTEVAAVVVSEPLNNTNRTVGSAGTPLDIATIRIVADDMSDVAPHEKGEICLRSASRYDGYFKNPAATQAKNLDGYVRTGDIGFIDQNGNLTILGRVDDMFNVSSENVYPAEIEAIGAELAGIENLIVLPAPSETTDNEVVMLYKSAADASELDTQGWEHLFRKRLSYYKIPRHIIDIKALGLDDWISTGSGKIDRGSMKSRMLQYLAAAK